MAPAYFLNSLPQHVFPVHFFGPFFSGQLACFQTKNWTATAHHVYLFKKALDLSGRNKKPEFKNAKRF